jgi:hypothetical protein
MMPVSNSNASAALKRDRSAAEKQFLRKRNKRDCHEIEKGRLRHSAIPELDHAGRLPHPDRPVEVLPEEIADKHTRASCCHRKNEPPHIPELTKKPAEGKFIVQPDNHSNHEDELREEGLLGKKKRAYYKQCLEDQRY